MTAEDHDVRPGGGRARAALIGFLLGFLVGVILLVVVGGNPFASANEVSYRDVVVGSVSDTEDSLCWSEDPNDRDESRTCAVLALDPQVRVPEVGDSITIGVVDLAPPGEESQRQIVHAAAADTGDGASPAPATDDPTGAAATQPDDNAS